MEKTNAWIEINIGHLQHNVQLLQSVLPKQTTFMAVVKADAYGHGAKEIATALNQMGIYTFAVARIEEGIALRKAGIVGEILVLGYTCASRAKELQEYDLIQTVVDYCHAVSLEQQQIPITIHIKIDTGMHRLGIPTKNILEIVKIGNMKYLQVQGIFTHLCVSDSQQKEDIIYTKKQIDCFYEVIETIKKQGVAIPKVHIQSSYGVIHYPYLKCDYARIGIAMYGTLSSIEKENSLDLQPVLSIKARILSLHTYNAGESIGYGRDYICSKTSQIAVVGIGYADGIPRCYNEKQSYVLVHGQKAPIIGRICMDQMMIDVSHINNIVTEDIVTIIGVDTVEIKVTDIAEKCHTITNEILSRLGSRLPKIYLKEKVHAL